MLTLFSRKKRRLPAGAESIPVGWTAPQSAAILLATSHRQQRLEHIWRSTSLSREPFIRYYQSPIERYAELVQQFPASEAHHHAYPGGMLDHGLETVVYALKLRQAHLLPAGADPEIQTRQADAWTAGVAYAALLHDIGKIAVDLQVEQIDTRLWHPWHGPLRQPYRFHYRKAREYRLHGAAAGLLSVRVLDEAPLDWLSAYPDLLAALLYVLAGHIELAGKLGELTLQADRASVAQAVGGDPVKALAAPKHALPRKLLDGLHYLVNETFKLNQPQASDGWLTQDALWLVSKTAADALRAHLLSQGIDGIPSSNVTLFDVLQEHGMAQATPDGKAIWKATVTSAGGWSHRFTLLKFAPTLFWETDRQPAPFEGTVQVESEQPATSDSTASISNDNAIETSASTVSSVPVMKDGTADNTGAHFMDWLRQGLQSGKLILNDTKALIHTVDDTAYLVSPGIFQRYVQEHPHIAAQAKRENLLDWQWLQKQFEHLHLHRKHANGLNIWACEVQGPRKSRTLHGYLLNDPALAFPRALPVWANNPYLLLLDG